MYEDDEVYHRRRAETEFGQMQSSIHPSAAAVHRMLADAYLDRAARLAADRMPIRIVD